MQFLSHLVSRPAAAARVVALVVPPVVEVVVDVRLLEREVNNLYLC